MLLWRMVSEVLPYLRDIEISDVTIDGGKIAFGTYRVSRCSADALMYVVQ